MTPHPPPPADIIERVRAICTTLAGSVEHEAWTGTSWRVTGTTYAHVVQITNGWPPSYSRTFDTTGPATVVTFQTDADDYRALAAIGPPYVQPPWRPGIVGLTIDANTDWTELTELLTDSHTTCSPTQARHRRRRDPGR